MKYLIIGASSGLGREIAYTFAKRQHDLILVARDERDLLPIKSDIEIKFNIKVLIIKLDFSDIDEIKKKILLNENIIKNLDGVLFPVGMMFDEDNKDLNEEKINKLIYVNFLSISFLISQLLNYLNKNLSIVGFGSVSGILGRNINSNYAAAKRALESFFESLIFENEKNNINIQFYTLGYLDTNLSFGKKIKLPKGSVKNLSEIVYKNKDKKFIKSYYPSYWGTIAFVLKIIPFKLIIIFKNFLK